MTALIIGFLTGAALVTVLAVLIARKPDATTTWVCVFCLQGFSRYESAQVHLCAAHPRPNQH